MTPNDEAEPLKWGSRPLTIGPFHPPRGLYMYSAHVPHILMATCVHAVEGVITNMDWLAQLAVK